MKKTKKKLPEWNPSQGEEVEAACPIYLYVDQISGVIKGTDMDAYVVGERLLGNGVDSWLAAANSWRDVPLDLSRSQLQAGWAWFLRKEREDNPDLMGPPAFDLVLFSSSESAGKK